MTGKIIHLNEWIMRKQLTNPLSKGRIPLLVSHIEGTVTGDVSESVGTKIANIKASLERLDNIMKD